MTYEDLYCNGVEQGVAKVKDIFAFLGLKAPNTNEFVKFLEPQNEQINTAQTYEKVPNIREINDRFGSKENGYLF
ncbi:hypothetical protein SDC9_212010 [bioreactor metagenome]|uniref:Uncharacterized protein n=1 Tax=bioreactor metagenome TaxID=1076179 RepID=A0A645JNA2_9ZZZZ